MTLRLFLVVVLAGPIDAGMTLFFWELEGNPVVLWLGPAKFLLVKLLVIVGLLWVATQTNIRETRAYQWGLWYLSILYTGVIATNLWVLLH